MLVIEITCLLVLAMLCVLLVLYGFLLIFEGILRLIYGEGFGSKFVGVVLIGFSCVGLWWLYTRIIVEVI